MKRHLKIAYTHQSSIELSEILYNHRKLSILSS